ncbi:hypothetical protein OQA88_952 [Cercophora sp. LCS_1]
MATEGASTPKSFAAIAPTPPGTTREAPSPMAHSCRTCAMRKVKCDKAAPACSSCRKAKLGCVYQSPAPRRRKRKLSGDLNPIEKLARYERILQQLGVLEGDESASPSAASTATAKDHEPIPLRLTPWGHSQAATTGKLAASHGKSRYIDSDLWGNLGDDQDEDGHAVSDEEQENTAFLSNSTLGDPLTGALMGYVNQNLARHHPTHAHAMAMWQVHAENVEPLLKILHIPSVATTVDAVSQRPQSVTRADECLLFAIYHFAVFSMTDQECIQKLGQPRTMLQQRFHLAARQALVNASFLKTTEMPVLQALVLFLTACRQSYDPHTFWILTGVAVRIAQRMGIHRDGSKLGLPPFQVEMRRRLFYQLMPLEATASQVSGSGIMMPPDTWDTQPALNVNDDQIWPDMTEPPQEKRGATDMIFCLSRFCIGKSIAGAGKLSREFQSRSEADRFIDKTEREVEDAYIRYCDVVNPLHFLAVCLARSGIIAMKLRARLPRARTEAATDEERREALQLAQKILDTDSAAHDHVGLMKRFRWYVSAFFLWGMWDSLVFLLTTLRKRPGLLSLSEIQSAWDRIERVYRNHPDLFDTKRALHVAFQRLTVRAWDASHQSPAQENVVPEFVKTLQSLRSGGKRAVSEGAAPSLADDPSADAISLGNFNIQAPLETIAADFSLELDPDDWTSWERLIESDHASKTDDAEGLS